MIRIFNIHFPTRKLVLVGAELLMIFFSFVLAAAIGFGSDSVLVLEYEKGFYKITAISVLGLVCMDCLDLYDIHRVPSLTETYFRLPIAVGILCFLLAGLSFVFPNFAIGNYAFELGALILTAALFGWRLAYSWLLRRPLLRERVYILGTGDRARDLFNTLKLRPELGMDIVAWTGDNGERLLGTTGSQNDVADNARENRIDRVIVALRDRRGRMPVRDLLEVRLSGVKVDEVNEIVEKISGKIEIEGLYPSWLIFAKGFRLSAPSLFGRRLTAFVVSLCFLLVALPLFPVIAALIKVTSPGPVFYRQKRVGRKGKIFSCYKFRSMKANAEADNRATWAEDNDPRITPLGKWLRIMRLDELPQLWNVLRGDMNFVGPRPERPEFVEWLTREIPYYDLRHIIRPGITGWAQVCYQYGASLEESREKLKYDLYYIKNASLSLDLVIILRTIKIIILGRGAR